MEKTLEDEKWEPEIALVWVVSARDVLQNYSGHELVYGSNMNTSSVLTAQLPTLEAAKMVRVNLNALHMQWEKGFIEDEVREKIHRAPRSNVRTYAHER